MIIRIIKSTPTRFGTLWVWMLMGVISGCWRLVGSSTLSCGSDNQYTLSVNPIDDDLNQLFHLSCSHDVLKINFTQIDGCTFPRVTHVKIEHCPLFEESLGSLLGRIGVEPSNVQSLQWYWSHNVGFGLQAWHLSGLHNLTVLQIDHNGFQSLPQEFLKPTKLLSKVYIMGNNITQLPSDLVEYIPQLTTLDLTRNHISEIPEDFLQNVPLLNVLNLWTNDIASLSPTLLSSNPKINMVILNSNKLIELEAELFSQHKHLYTIQLTSNQLQTLPELAFEGCSNLTYLTLEHNKLSSLPVNIFRGTSIKVINLGFNQLSNLTGTFSNLESLENITLQQNQIENLHETTFQGSSNIVKLDLQVNNIGTLPAKIFRNLGKMRIILLNNNTLTELPSELFTDCISLLQIYLGNNSLTTIPADTFRFHSDIYKIDLSVNQLKFENPWSNPLNRLTNLKEVNLANNRITYIPEIFHTILFNVRVLNLQNNLISIVQTRQLKIGSNNVTMNLKNNNISRIIIYPQLLNYDKVEKYLYLNLAGNPLICDCNIFNFLKFAQLSQARQPDSSFKLVVVDAASAKCSNPENIKGVALVNVDRTKIICSIKCSNECRCDIREHDKVIFMKCSPLWISEPPRIPKRYSKYELNLDLSNNNIENTIFLMNLTYHNMTNLSLANNSIVYINQSLLPSTLRYLDLRWNNFSTVSQHFVDHLSSSHLKLMLGRNPWLCDCDLQSLHGFLRENYEQVGDLRDVQCGTDGVPVEDHSLEDLCNPLHHPLVMGSLVAGLLIIVVLTVFVTVCLYQHQNSMKLWLYTHKMCLWAVTEREVDADKIYDAFVSYSYKDEDFVNSILVPGLEYGEPSYKLCLHYRDWVPGEFIQDQILSSVKASRRTVIVLSKNFTDSMWGQMEFQAAHSQALRDKTNRIIVILYGEVPSNDELTQELKTYVSLNTYLKWGDPKFWERLRYAMPHVPHVKKTHPNAKSKSEANTHVSYLPRLKSKNKKKQGDKMRLGSPPYKIEPTTVDV